MKFKKTQSIIIGFVVMFLVLFTIFLASYYFISPLLEKSRSKTKIKEVEYNLIQLKNKLESVLKTKTQQFYTFPVIEGKLSVLNNFGFYYFIQVPYSPYTNNWYDLLNKKSSSLDICEIDGNKLKNCFAQYAICRDISGYLGYKECVFPLLENLTLLYRKVKGASLGYTGNDKNKDYYISVRPFIRVVGKDESLCSIYTITTPGKKDKVEYYLLCNVLKEGNICYIPLIKGNFVLVPITNKKIIISFVKEKYIPNFNYFGCSEGYYRIIKVEIK